MNFSKVRYILRIWRRDHNFIMEHIFFDKFGGIIWIKSIFLSWYNLDIDWEKLKSREAPIIPNGKIVYEKKESFSCDPFFSVENDNEV